MTFLPRFSYLDVCKLVLLYPSVLTSLPESAPLRTLDEERAVEATGATRKRLSARRVRVCVSYNNECGLRCVAHTTHLTRAANHTTRGWIVHRLSPSLSMIGYPRPHKQASRRNSAARSD
jgi:hypothetical protein